MQRKYMNCKYCKAKVTEGKVNHIADRGEGIIIIKNVPARIFLLEIASLEFLVKIEVKMK